MKCPACEHEVSAHDAVAQRWCSATVDRSIPRDCICRTISS